MRPLTCLRDTAWRGKDPRPSDTGERRAFRAARSKPRRPREVGEDATGKSNRNADEDGPAGPLRWTLVILAVMAAFIASVALTANLARAEGGQDQDPGMQLLPRIESVKIKGQGPYKAGDVITIKVSFTETDVRRRQEQDQDQGRREPALRHCHPAGIGNGETARCPPLLLHRCRPGTRTPTASAYPASAPTKAARP